MPNNLIVFAILYHLTVSRNAFSKAKNRQFETSGNTRLLDCREPTGLVKTTIKESVALHTFLFYIFDLSISQDCK